MMREIAEQMAQANFAKEQSPSARALADELGERLSALAARLSDIADRVAGTVPKAVSSGKSLDANETRPHLMALLSGLPGVIASIEDSATRIDSSIG